MFAPILVPVSSVSGVDGENDNVIDLDDARLPSAKHTRIPAGTILFTAFHCGHPSEPDIHGVREYEGHPDEVRLRGQLLRITLGKKRLTLREQRLVHRMLVPVMNTGQATSEEKVVMALMAIGYDLSKRRAIYGPQHRVLRAWLELRVTAVWAFESMSGEPPDWLTDLAEILAQEAIRPAEVAKLTPANYFTPWEREAKIKYY